MATVAAPVDQISVYNSIMPKEGPKAIPVTLDFSTTGTLLVDFTLPMNQKRLSAIQTLSVRNWLNAQSISVVAQGFPEPFDIAPGCDVFMPIPAQNLAKFLFTTTGNLIIPVTFWNIPLPAFQMFNPTFGQPVSISGTIAVTGTVDTLSAPGVPANPAAFAIVTGGTAVAAIASPTKGAKIINPPEAVEPLFVDWVHNAGTIAPGANGTTVELGPGQSIDIPSLTGTITANAATSGHPFTAFQW